MIAGWSVQEGSVEPELGAISRAEADVASVLATNSTVKAFRVMPNMECMAATGR